MLPPDMDEKWGKEALEYLIKERGGVSLGKAWLYKKSEGQETGCSGTPREPHEEIHYDTYSSCPVCELKNELDGMAKERTVREEELRDEIDNLETDLLVTENELDRLRDTNIGLQKALGDRIIPGENIPDMGRKIRA